MATYKPSVNFVVVDVNAGRNSTTNDTQELTTRTTLSGDMWNTIMTEAIGKVKPLCSANTKRITIQLTVDKES